MNPDIYTIYKNTAEMGENVDLSLNVKKILDDTAPNIETISTEVKPGSNKLLIITTLKNIETSLIQISLLQLDLSE